MCVCVCVCVCVCIYIYIKHARFHCYDIQCFSEQQNFFLLFETRLLLHRKNMYELDFSFDICHK